MLIGVWMMALSTQAETEMAPELARLEVFLGLWNAVVAGDAKAPGATGTAALAGMREGDG